MNDLLCLWYLADKLKGDALVVGTLCMEHIHDVPTGLFAADLSIFFLRFPRFHLKESENEAK